VTLNTCHPEDRWFFLRCYRKPERANILAALRQAGGRIRGPGGAAERLGLKPTTLASRIKALGIPKPTA
jgi:transcriptional regulator with GAF, ATPase, and Fis domain